MHVFVMEADGRSIKKLEEQNIKLIAKCYIKKRDVFVLPMLHGVWVKDMRER